MVRSIVPSVCEEAVESDTLRYAVVLPGLRAGFRLDSNRGSIKIGPPAGRRPAGEPISKLARLESGRKPARKPDFRAGNTIA